MVNRPEKHWKEWGRPEWDSALFFHFFFDVEGTSVPVRTLSVTQETLVLVTGDHGAVPEDVKLSFLKAVGNDPSAIRHHLSPSRYFGTFKWLSEEPPHFFLYLTLTCFVASASDGAVSEIGNFRDRMRILLGNDESVSYGLDGLNTTWTLLKTWLDHHRSKGAQYRGLELPDPGHMVLIGYSIRLAFPKRRDLIKLIDIFADAKLGDDPSPFEVIQLVGKNRNWFTDHFRKEFDAFKAAYFGKDRDVGKSPFWAAVKAAVSADRIARKERRSKFGLILFPSESGFEDDMFLLSDTELDIEYSGKPVRFVRAESNVGRLPYIAVPGAGGGEDPLDIIGALMDWDLFRSVPALKKSPLSVSIGQGVLLFVKNEVGLYESCTNNVRDSSVKVYVWDDLKDEFLAAFPEDRKPEFHKDCRYTGWVESEPFDAEDLFSMKIASGSKLERIRCLQRPIENPSLHLSGGIRVEDGYLGIPPCLPEIHAPEADAVQMIPLSDGKPIGDGAGHILNKTEGGEGVFTITVPPSSFLEGQYSIVARRGEDVVVGVKRIEFHSNAAPSEYKYPSNPSNWYVESGGPDVLPYNLASRGWQLGSEAPPLDAGKYDHNIRNRSSVPKFPLYSSEEVYSSEAGALIEICAGKTTRKRGIPEAEFIDLLQRVFPLGKRSHVWDLARSWTENCYLDRLIDRTWKGSCYYPVRPHLVVRRTGARYQAALVGLATREIRQFVAKSMLSGGALQEERFSHSPMVPAPLMWSSEMDGIFSRIAEEINISIVGSLDVSDRLWSVGGVIAKVSLPPGGYRRKGIWDWNKGYFVSEDQYCGSRSPVLVEWMTRTRSDSPDYYLVSWADGKTWWTYSRNWALLAAYTLCGQVPLVSSGGTELVEIGLPRVYLPLVYARWLSVSSRIVPSPIFEESGRSDYTYAFPTKRERDRFLGMFWDRSANDSVILSKTLKTLLSEANRFRRSEERTLPLPGDIREILDSLTANPQAKELARSRFPARMIPGIRTAFAEFGIRRGENG